MKRILFLCALVAPRVADAFCGFYVATGDAPMYSDATQVVLMRNGTRTVLAMQNAYKGPPEAFAIVIPVPVVLHEADVKTLPAEVFPKVEAMSAPRLVEYWEQDPCVPAPMMGMACGTGTTTVTKLDPKTSDLGVKIEAKFAVGEYQIVILSASDSTGLDTWLRKSGYTIPDAAAPLLRPYVEAGSKFFVAKVDPKKVRFENGQAILSPLRFHYDDEHFALPIRLGLASSAGTQDLIVNIFAPHQRYEVANYPNVTIPTNLDVRDSVRERFASFYAALFDRTLELHPRAVVTEYAWQATTCDPCPGPTLDPRDLATLGADVLAGSREHPQPYDAYDLVLTRLHARYGKDVKDDLVFAQARPIVGGREYEASGARADSYNNFQARYAIRHPWTGPITCEHPQRGMWGGPPRELGIAAAAPKPALGLAFAPRGQIVLASAFAQNVPEIDLRAGASDPTTPHGAGVAPISTERKTRTGCGCVAGDGDVFGFGVVLVWLGYRRRRGTG